MSTLDSPPMRAINDHVHFDTEVVKKDFAAPFFHDCRRFVSGAPKVSEIDTNLRSGGQISGSPCRKEIASIKVVTPRNTKVRLVFMFGCDPVVDQVVSTNVDLDLKQNVTKLRQCMGERLGSLVETECFGMYVTGLDDEPPYRARVEIKGRFDVQDFANPAWAAWHSGLVDDWVHGRGFVGLKAHPVGQGRGDGLFDTEVVILGRTRFFVNTRQFRDGARKEYGLAVLSCGRLVDTNMVGNGGALPRGHVLHVTNVTVDCEGRCVSPVKVSLVTAMNHVLASAEVERGKVTPIGPVWTVGCEDFEVWVEATSATGKTRVLLGGDYYKPMEG